MTIGPTNVELADILRDDNAAMPDTATVLRNTPTRSATGGSIPNFQPHHTTPCRLTASVLSGGGEQDAASQLAGIMAYTLTVPAGTDIRPSDRVQIPDMPTPRVFEVAAGKTVASWNMSDAWTLTEIQRA